MKGFLSDWWRDFFALAGFIAIVVQIAAAVREFSLTNRREESVERFSGSGWREISGTLRKAYQETKKTNFHLGFRLFYLHLVISAVVATLVSFGLWPKDFTPASPLGILIFIGLTHDVIELDDWIKNNKPSYLLHSWRLAAWLFVIAFSIASALALAFIPSLWLLSFLWSQFLGIATILVISLVYYAARLLRLTD
jgi:hypothetical protein